MKYTNLIAAVFMGASSALAAPTLVKDTIQDLAGSFDAAAHMLLKSANISVPGAGPEPTRNLVPVDGALVKTRDGPSNITCDSWVDDGGMYSVSADSVRKNIEQLRGRSDKPPTVAPGDCELATLICDDNSGIGWCVGDDQSNSFTADSWGMIADAAQAVLDTCSPNDEDVDGEALYGDVWFVAASYMNKGCEK